MPFLPTLASSHGSEIDRILLLIHLLMASLFVIWFVYFAVVLYRFRRSRNPQASAGGAKTKASYYLEIGVIVIEVSLLIGLALPFWSRQVAAQNAPPENAVRVRIIAQQYAWNIHYPGDDGVYGRTAVDLVDPASNPLGLDYQDEAAKDDIFKLNELHIPVNRPVYIELTSLDVIHSFNALEFRVKQDAIPGIVAKVVFTPTITTDEFRAEKGASVKPDRTFEIACAQLCGLGHYRMIGYITVHTEEAFAAWLTENKPDPAAMENYDPLFN